jgi:hypothetical protein
MFQNPSILVLQGGCEGWVNVWSVAKRMGKKARKGRKKNVKGKRGKEKTME